MPDSAEPASTHPPPSAVAGALRGIERLVLEKLAAGLPLRAVLEQLVLAIESQREGLLGSLIQLDSSGQRIESVVAPRLPPAYNQMLLGQTAGPRAGSCGTAMYRRELVIVEDIATDPLWADFREMALPLGLRACWSSPIFGEGGRLIGTFAFYYRHARQPSAEEIALVRGASEVARFALYFGRAQAHLHLLNAAVARLNDVVIITDASLDDPDGPRIVFVNEAFERVTGYSRDEALGRSPGFLRGPETSQADLERVDLALRARQPIRAELLNYSKAGLPFWVELEASRIVEPGSKTEHFVFIERDITERKRADRALREQQRMMATLLGNLPGMAYRCQGDPIWTMDFVSEGCRALTGYRAEELVGNRLISYREVIESEDRAPVSEVVHRAVEKRQAYELTYRIRTREGGLKWVWERGQALFTPAGTVQFLEGFVSDITERKLLEAQVVQSQRLESIGTLAGGIAHDLNNVFAPIVMAGNLLRTRVPEGEPQRLLATLTASAHRGAGLVRQILLFARGMEGMRIAVTADALFAEIRPFLESTFPKSIQAEFHLAPGLPPILGDPTQLNQVLLNLCVNARDAMDEGGRLTLSASADSVDPSGPRPHPDALPGDYIRLDVADTGTGIPEELRGRIFDPFFTTKDVGRGTGLGLSTARAIVKSHRGFMKLESAPNRGTTFSVFLPRAQPEPEADSAPLRPVPIDQAMPRGSGELILVVDDEESVRVIMRSALENYGFAVATAEDGAAAVAMLAKARSSIALAIVDLQMPGMDGGKTMRALRQIEPTLPLISASGFATASLRAQAEACGVRHFLDKPFGVEKLLHAVRDALHSRIR